MNHHIDDTPSFDDPAREREWLAQENAMRRESMCLEPIGDNAKSQQYRLLARVLRTAPPIGLPPDFAQQLSALAAARTHERPPGFTFESVMTTVLAGALLLAATAVTVIYGAAWWPSFQTLLPTPVTAQWLLALIGCLGISWLLGACRTFQKLRFVA